MLQTSKVVGTDALRVGDAVRTPAAGSGRIVPPSASIRVLFVDDDPDITQLLVSGMHDEGFEIHTSASADEALRVLAATPIDVVVSDQQMPGTSGCKFLAAVGRQWPETMRIMLSGCADLRATLDAINEAHVFRFLTKPCRAKDVAYCIRQAAAAKERPRTSGPINAALSARLNDAELERFRETLERIRMAYQPIVSANSAELFGYEALVRCSDPGFASPIELITHAEQIGAVEILDSAIRGLIAADMADIPARLRVLVNVHPRSLLDERLFSPDDPLRVGSDRVVIEITEREGLADVADVPERVARLRALGYRIAIDDLGAGYAGLSTFAQLVPEIVKFDMELIRGIHRSTTKAKLVRSMTALCREMNIKTIAEGIETNEERRRVTELGCDLLQGYLIGRPRHLA